jgi:hypothetical protein
MKKTILIALTAGLFAVTAFAQSSVFLPAVNSEWHVVGVGLFFSQLNNGLEPQGIVWENQVTNAHVIWRIENGVTTSTINLPTVGFNWHVVGIADFNSDGLADLLWENAVTGQHAIWFTPQNFSQDSVSKDGLTQK